MPGGATMSIAISDSEAALYRSMSDADQDRHEREKRAAILVMYETAQRVGASQEEMFEVMMSLGLRPYPEISDEELQRRSAEASRGKCKKKHRICELCGLCRCTTTDDAGNSLKIIVMQRKSGMALCKRCDADQES